MKRCIPMISTLLFLVWTGLAGAAAPVQVGLSDVIATVEKCFTADSSGQTPVNDFTANFFQSTTMSQQKRELRGEGLISVKMPVGSTPLMFRFEYLRPNRQEIVSDGASLWIYHPENREVILADVGFLFIPNSFGSNRNNRSINFLQGLGRISKDFQIVYAAGTHDVAGNYVLELTPRRPMLNTRRIYMVVSRESVLSYINVRNPPPASQPQPTFPLKRQPLEGMTPFGQKSDLFPILSTTIDDHEGNRTTMEFTNIRINNRLPQSVFRFVIPPNVQVVRPSEQTLPH